MKSIVKPVKGTKRLKELINQQQDFLCKNCLVGKGCHYAYVDEKTNESTQVMYCANAEMMIGDRTTKIDDEGRTCVHIKGFQITCVEVLSIEGKECDLYEESD